MNKFWELMAGKLVERWASLSVGALVFWAGGLVAVAYGSGGVPSFATSVMARPVVLQVVAVAGALVLVAASSLLVRRLSSPVLSLLQGPWHGLGLTKFSSRMAKRQRDKANDLTREWRGLAELLEKQPSAETQRRYVYLDDRLRRRPDAAEAADFLPTPIGNVVRAADCRVVQRFGLFPATVWPRLWLILPEDVKDELRTARNSVDACVSTAIWGAGFALFGFLDWRAAVAGVVVLVLTIWFWLPSRVAAFTDLTESVFELHRFALYEQLRLPVPVHPDEEHVKGTQLTVYLFRGISPRGVDFTGTTEGTAS